jgi:hypothetical protein
MNKIYNLFMEPEVHIQFYGVDHYIETMFPNDTLDKRQWRRSHLLSYECLMIRQMIYESKKLSRLFPVISNKFI